MNNRKYIAAAFFGYLAFVVYGSLIPFELRDLGFEQALQRFENIRYLDLGIGSRADWVANIVLYVPLSFLGCGLLMGIRDAGISRYFSPLLVLSFCILVAVSVEFTQLFFAPRTVSINDLIAEALGTIGGIGVWLFGRRQLCHLWDSFHEGGQKSVLAALYSYFLIYFAQTLFPFDFVISLDEISQKAAGEGYGWLIVGDCSSVLRCTARLLGEGFAVAPLGLLISLAFSNISLKRTFVAGLILGFLIELLQFFLGSGVSQGFSVVMRGAGFAFGLMVGQFLKKVEIEKVAKVLWWAMLSFFIPYLVAVLFLAGWFNTQWLPLSSFSERVVAIKLLPFYYHYYSSESGAMANLLANFSIYSPVGLFVWANQIQRGSMSGAMDAIIIGGGLALIVELGKVFIPLKHPDLTNVLIAVMASIFVYLFAVWVGAVLKGR